MHTCNGTERDAQLPDEIPAHRPDTSGLLLASAAAPSALPGCTYPACLDCSLKDWGESLSSAVSPEILIPSKAWVAPEAHCSLQSYISGLSSHSKLFSQVSDAPFPSQCPPSVEKELDSLLGNTVQGVLMGDY